MVEARTRGGEKVEIDAFFGADDLYPMKPGETA